MENQKSKKGTELIKIRNTKCAGSRLLGLGDKGRGWGDQNLEFERRSPQSWDPDLQGEGTAWLLLGTLRLVLGSPKEVRMGTGGLLPQHAGRSGRQTRLPPEPDEWEQLIKEVCHRQSPSPASQQNWSGNLEPRGSSLALTHHCLLGPHSRMDGEEGASA